MNQTKSRRKTDAFLIPADVWLRRQPFRVMMSVIVALALVILIAFFSTVAWHCVEPRIDYPHQLDHGEGLMLALWQTKHSGAALYSPIDELPWVINNYPPLYTAVVSRLADQPRAALRIGRILSFLSLLWMMLMIALVVIGARRGGLGWPSLPDCLAGALAGIGFGLTPHVLHWGTLMRVDVMGLSLALTGLALVSMAGRRKTWPVVVAALFFLAALATKHSLLAAPLAVILGCLNHRRRRAVKLSVALVLAGGILFGIGWWQTKGQLFQHLIVANQTESSVSLGAFHVARVWHEMGQLIVLSILGVGMSLSVFLTEYRPKGRTPRLVLAHYFWLTAVGLIMTAKSGSSSNYYLEFYCCVALTMGLFIADLIAVPAILVGKNLVRRLPYLFLIAVTQVLMFATHPLIPLDFSAQNWVPVVPSKETGRGVEAITERLRQVDGPILSQDMSLVVLANKSVMYHPFLMPDLAKRKLWSDALLIRMIEDKSFPKVVLSQELDPSVQYQTKDKFGAMFTHGTLRAIQSSYTLSNKFELVPFGEWIYFYTPKQ